MIRDVRTISNLTPKHGLTIDNASIVDEVKRISDGQEIEKQQAFYCQELGKVTHRKIIGTLVDKFKAERTSIGRDNEKRRALLFIQENLDRKGIEYDVPDEIKILPPNHEISFGPDTFDSILEDKVGTQGTQGTVLEGMDEGIDERKDSQIVKEKGDIENSNRLHEDTKDVIKPEDTPTHPLEASPSSPSSPFECYYCKQHFLSRNELIAHMDKESADAREKRQTETFSIDVGKY